MKKLVRDLMTKNPATVSASATVAEAARLMRDNNTGAMLVEENGTICGIVTDRDIAIRAVANDENPRQLTVSRICSKQVETLPPDATTDQAVDMMRQKAVRRIPVVDRGRPVGIISLGDLALALDPRSALADISAAPPNQ